MASSYKEKVNWLFHQFPVFQKVGASAYKPTLENTLSLIRFFNVPINDMSFVHVAGTNGKGTTCSIIASGLTSAGKRTGLFTSPHIKDFRERIRINGVMISQSKVVEYIDRVQNASFDFSPSFFEITWVMALAYFFEEAVDMVVVETGLGGRLDATNVIKPQLSVITNIGLDHVAILGETRGDIAKEKAGIIKNGIPVLIGESDDEISQVFIDIAERKEAPIQFLPIQLGKSTFELNKLLAYRSLEVLLGDSLEVGRVKESAITDLYRNTGLYGRNQLYSKDPLIVLDAAHNAMGVERFIRDIKSQYPEKSVGVLYGTSNDKDLMEIAKLFPLEWKYYFTEFNSSRSLKIDAFKSNEYIKQLKCRYFTNASKAFFKAKTFDYESDMLIVFGSFFLLEEIL
ncbi:bifunctional folylpolyglutamate synthase/dihydrofolate synthase [Brumimicrobium oceani]|uniref:Tetrahydrofolate synthase n=1 Tax=Brumimicrobium oceani TaxID=2100725 RepID=A0A2U2X0E5_9FLAO|nr:Mur ligase family protein [Brumimicrobium oceani]PWH81243.1 tetrahydrofolate synthase [Brumimicrobium oceani]